MTRRQTITVNGTSVRCVDHGDGWRPENIMRPDVRRLIRQGAIAVEDDDRIVNPAQYGLPA